MIKGKVDLGSFGVRFGIVLKCQWIDFQGLWIQWNWTLREAGISKFYFNRTHNSLINIIN